MKAETRRLLKQAIDQHVREQLEVSRVDFCAGCGVAMDVAANRRADVVCKACRDSGFSVLRREEGSWLSRMAGRVSGRTPTWIPGTTQ